MARAARFDRLGELGVRAGAGFGSQRNAIRKALDGFVQRRGDREGRRGRPHVWYRRPSFGRLPADQRSARTLRSLCSECRESPREEVPCGASLHEEILAVRSQPGSVGPDRRGDETVERNQRLRLNG